MAGKDGLTMQEEVRRKLAALGRDPDAVEARTMGQLERLEGAVRAEAASVRAAKATLRGRGFALNAMSAASGISRATFYNKPLLAEYVELSKGEAVGEPDAVASKAELDEARRRIGQLMARDGELVLALADNERLGKRVAALEQALADRATHFEGMPAGNVVRLRTDDGKEEK